MTCFIRIGAMIALILLLPSGCSDSDTPTPEQAVDSETTTEASAEPAVPPTDAMNDQDDDGDDGDDGGGDDDDGDDDDGDDDDSGGQCGVDCGQDDWTSQRRINHCKSQCRTNCSGNDAIMSCTAQCSSCAKIESTLTAN